MSSPPTCFALLICFTLVALGCADTHDDEPGEGADVLLDSTGAGGDPPPATMTFPDTPEGLGSFDGEGPGAGDAGDGLDGLDEPDSSETLSGSDSAGGGEDARPTESDVDSSECASNADCPGGYCEPISAMCVECLFDTDCDDADACTVDTCQASTSTCANDTIPGCCG